jgi:hypothetical protein
MLCSQIWGGGLPQKIPPPMMFPSRVGMIPFQMYIPTVMCGAPTQIPNGMNVILATTWSKPSDTNAKVGHQIPITFEARSRPWIPKKQARHTSQLHPMPRKSIMWNSGVTCFFVAKEMTADLKGSAENTFPSIGYVSLLIRRNSLGSGFRRTAKDNSHDKQRSGQVPEECHHPVN